MYKLNFLPHNSGMTTTQNKQNQSKSKKNNAMRKIGQGLKETFMEMSESLAGWIDDTGNQFTKKKKQSGTKNCGTAGHKTCNNTVEKPKPEPGIKK